MTEQFWAVIPAAGNGSRFSSTTAKQYAMLAGKPVIAHSLATLCDDPRVAGVVVALAGEDDTFRGLLEEIKARKKIYTVQGGASRAQSVLNGLQFLEQLVNPNDFVLVHDAARPLLHKADLSFMLEQLSHHEVGGVLANAVVDTLKRVAKATLPVIQETQSREALWCAQTPQMFRYQLLKSALEMSLSELGDDLTDESMAMERQGYKPLIVPAQFANFKITYQRDLCMAELIVTARAQGQNV